ncbi:MAG TPA: imidazole glycerol phosphate synthase subunit HisH [Thermoanaerobaculaceae bacterium]|nr:imidazole glycerol phosphate synthase subunit HisH [Thermoanaerobaculaceae bacterium]
MRVVVVDTGVGNVPNAVRGLARAGAEVTLSADPAAVRAAERVVLPGVGAFPAGMAALRERGLDAAVREAAGRGAAVLGICLGHQLLFESSGEFGRTAGLGLLAGNVTALPPVARVPHMGWSRLEPRRADPLLDGLGGDAWMYFVHSFAAVPANGDLLASVRFGGAEVAAVVRRGRVCGAQFHPEKSGAAGARFLANFLERV